MRAPAPVVSFVVRVSQTESGRLRGTVERVRTGERQPFAGARALASALTRLAGDAHRDSRTPRLASAPAKPRARSLRSNRPDTT